MKAETTLNQWVTTRSSMTRSHSLELKLDAVAQRPRPDRLA
jgi:hypothetical protein